MDTTISNFIQDREREFIKLTEGLYHDPRLLRETTRKTSFVSQMFMLDFQGRLLYPDPENLVTNSERDFLRRTQDILNGEELLYQVEEDSMQQVPLSPKGLPTKQNFQQQVFSISKSKTIRQPQSHGHYVWYWGKGVHLLFWKVDESGNIIGAELDKVRLVADIIGLLPETDPLSEDHASGRIRLQDSRNDIVYQWGMYEPGEKEKPLVSRSLTQPLNTCMNPERKKNH
jgi:hypothetical protein